ncbi:hypothetical protein BTN49_1409 [Candidatus Enterovibrio escicola]|uniref:Uncharacterized protein n=1 Tax=Candidatus Enterovibrio escicola TaxID=1927127 RepID=A0A2A5T3X9_9GAMM|nr:hypothetical protein BTN49_1409 [Candidatus Enterovibrio escacola]
MNDLILKPKIQRIIKHDREVSPVNALFWLCLSSLKLKHYFMDMFAIFSKISELISIFKIRSS